MKNNCLKMAFYGKGGIGKTTTACNVSACLSGMGLKVLHIGCDPKADSTRLLTEKRIPTVLSQLQKLGSDIDISDILFPGICNNLFVVESGGPKAGQGCAGAGITVMNELLTQLGILQMDWDVILYDVLGDVVCGGFSVPMKSSFVDKVYVVTSSEYMSIYAANNILGAVKSYSYDQKNLLGGLIWNHTQGEKDRVIAERFSKLTGAEVIQFLSEDQEIQRCDYKRVPVVLESPEHAVSKEMKMLTESIMKTSNTKTGEQRIRSCELEELEKWREEIQILF